MIFIDQTQSLMLKHFLVEPAPYQNCRTVNNQTFPFLTLLLFPSRAWTALYLSPGRAACDMWRKQRVELLHLLATARDFLDSFRQYEVVHKSNCKLCDHMWGSCFSLDRSDHTALVVEDDIVLIGGASYSYKKRSCRPAGCPLANGEMLKSKNTFYVLSDVSA